MCRRVVDYGRFKLQFQNSSGKVQRTIRTTSLAQLSKQLPMCNKQQSFLFTDTYVAFALFTVVAMKSYVFWHKPPCNLVKVNRYFERGTAFCLLHSDFLLALLFDPDDVGYMVDFHQTKEFYIPNTELFHPKNPVFSCYT